MAKLVKKLNIGGNNGYLDSGTILCDGNALDKTLETLKGFKKVDSNGWTVIDRGTQKDYYRKVTFTKDNLAMPTWGHYDLCTMPEGLSDLDNNCYLQLMLFLVNQQKNCR